MKRFTIKCLATLLMMMVAGEVWGAEQPLSVIFSFGYAQWDGITASLSGTAQDEVTQTQSNVVCTYTRNGSSLYANTSALRFYKSNTLKFDAPDGYKITAISFTCTGFQSDFTSVPDACSSTSDNLSWINANGSTSVTFTRPSNATSYATITGATVTLESVENIGPTPKHKVFFSVNGSLLDDEGVDVEEGAAIVFPDEKPDDIQGKSFVGWTDECIDGTTDTQPTLFFEATMGTQNVTYYAVFANLELESSTVTWNISGVNTSASGGRDVNTTLKTSSISPTTETGVWTAVATSSYAGTSSSKAQLGSNSYKFVGTISLSGSAIPADAQITQIDLTATSSATDANPYTISATVGKTAFGTSQSLSTGSPNCQWKDRVVGNTIVLTTSCGYNKNIVISALSVVYESFSGSDYCTIVGTRKSVSSLSISGTPTQTTYYAGDAFDPAGLVVTGTYSDGSEGTITEGIEWSIDPETLTLGTTSVDVIASVGSVVSEAYTVNGLTVTENPYKTATISTFNATSGDINDDISYEAFKGSGTADPFVNNNNLRLYQNGGYVTIAAKTGLKIAKVKITTSSTYASTTVGYCVDEEDAPTTGETVAKSSTYTISNLNNQSVSIYCLGTDKNTRLEIAEIEVTYNGTLVVELESIALSGTYPTAFTQGDAFSHEGMVVTATMTDKSTKDVSASAAFSDCDMTKVGEQTVTVSYTEDEITKTASYKITVRKAPFVPTPAQDGYETVDLASLYSDVTTNATVEDYEGTSFSMKFEKPQSSTTPTKYYASGKAVRAYVGNTITITAAEDIMAVVVNYVNNYVDDGQTITGLGSTSAVITFSKTCRFTSITVYYCGSSRTMSLAEGQTKWGTICLPCEVIFTTITGAEFYNVLGVTMTESEISGVVLGKESGNLVAGKPYLFKATDNLFCAYTGYAVESPADATGLVGSFEECDVPQGCYVLSNNQIRLVNGGVAKIGPNRAYLDLSGVEEYRGSAANALRFGFDGEVEDYTTYIQTIQYDAEVQIYDLQGNKIQTMKPGQLYIVNGKKMFNK